MTDTFRLVGTDSDGNSVPILVDETGRMVVRNDPGPTGPTGPAGPAGADGAAGAAGPQGPQGDQGPAGPTGPAGPAGANGAAGAAGSAATVAVGTVTTGAAGSSATVTNTGTSSAAVLNFAIPKGDTGATGPAGPSNVVTVNLVTANGTALNGSIDYFVNAGGGSIDLPALDMSITAEAFLRYTKNTAGTVRPGISSTEGFTGELICTQSPATGANYSTGGTPVISYAGTTSDAYQTTIQVPSTASLTTGVEHHTYLRFNAHRKNVAGAGNIKVTLAVGAGTFTPLAGSFIRVQYAPWV